jgi:hypothetical protein
MKHRWHFLGIEWHRRWREGKTWLDNAGGDHLLVHHGFYSLEWARGPDVDFYRARKAAQAS